MDLKEELKAYSKKFLELKKEVHRSIIGQNELINGLFMSLLCNGHILIEGLPGLAKTSTIKTFSELIGTSFKRIQFTPDLLPSDLIGTVIYEQQRNEFVTKKGPIFTNFLLTDEINRAPAKVQSALLEAMQERQVTIYNETHKLKNIFLVMATQNPIEQEGTYTLPEAQLDRFMLKIDVFYPSKNEEFEILNLLEKEPVQNINIIDEDFILKAREIVKKVYADDKIKRYIIDIVNATRHPEEYKLDIKTLLSYGASPRASIYLLQGAKAFAFLKSRDYIIPEDIKEISNYILNHRIGLSYEAIAEKIHTKEIVSSILNKVSVP
ncbi:MAG: MoxR family ATPase [Candidatus Sericytochromatia bacterium]